MDKIDLAKVAREMFPDAPQVKPLGCPAGDLKLTPLRLLALPESVMKHAPLRALRAAIDNAKHYGQEQVQVIMPVAFAAALLDTLQS